MTVAIGCGAGGCPLSPGEKVIALFEIVDANLSYVFPFDPTIEQRGHAFELPMGNEQKAVCTQPVDRTTKELSA